MVDLCIVTVKRASCQLQRKMTDPWFNTIPQGDKLATLWQVDCIWTKIESYSNDHLRNMCFLPHRSGPQMCKSTVSFFSFLFFLALFFKGEILLEFYWTLTSLALQTPCVRRPVGKKRSYHFVWRDLPWLEEGGRAAVTHCRQGETCLEFRWSTWRHLLVISDQF